MSTRFDVTAIGNAIVDVIAQAEDAFLEKHKLPKGAMNLIDTETAEPTLPTVPAPTTRAGTPTAVSPTG